MCPFHRDCGMRYEPYICNIALKPHRKRSFGDRESWGVETHRGNWPRHYQTAGNRQFCIIALFFLFFICLGEKDKTPETITFWDGLQPAAEFSSVSDPQGPFLYMTRQKEHAVVLSFFFFFFLAMLCWGLPSHPIRWLAT